ncbi:Transcriptional regulator HilA [Defluviimonas aquaemixtae]|uniref:Transcriptional regulator HilA n=1 Tax=Albidovulum aquaemixtae TaxID=1542388 RepID=A0A2R8BMM6_9RHOB|nr:winged helix-turn-helix domain-containing protein [Defluviimonas aquaemixtae]SPH24693.1 Transcriptional regulator HilA [Defluviimonas aquaemixtae]
MLHRFEDFELDLARAELRRAGAQVTLEPRAFDLLALLVDCHDRMVSKDEIVEKVWHGRFITDAAISTGIKAVRHALGDDGASQRFVRTLRGRGFRFVAPVRTALAAEAAPDGPSPAPPSADAGVGRPVLAVLPFEELGTAHLTATLADALPAELISSLSRMRWIGVIARGSSFRFRGPSIDFDALRQSLGAGYCLSGTVEIAGDTLSLWLELTDTATHRVIWSDRATTQVDGLHETRTRIVGEVMAALEVHIPLNEAEKARLRTSDRLDAWALYHIGLRHMYRFNRADNALAADHFRRATEMDPDFARAFAARSFASFQSAFLVYSPDRDRDASEARRFAERAVELDPLDPFANYTLGRAHWLDGRPEAGMGWLDRAVELSPSFASGHYSRGWVNVIAGDTMHAHDNAGTALKLSPLDPLAYAMNTVRGLACLAEGDFAPAAQWAERGALSPGAHVYIAAIASATQRLAGNDARADFWAARVAARDDAPSLAQFFAVFPFRDDRMVALLRRALPKAGFRD